MNIYKYIENTKDLELDKLNDVDALVLTRLSYIHFEKISKLPIKIKDLPEHLKEIHTTKKDIKLINLLKESKRFKNLIIKRCNHILDISKEEQLTIITIILPNKSKFIAFRGTTKNIYDFKEDMNMSYKIVPSCVDAVKYINEEYNGIDMYLGGHSKGGHLAMYALIHTKWYIKRKIKKVYNFDGPGFLEIDDKFLKVKNKIINYFPENSIVGRIMNNISPIIPIKVNKQGIESHNIYNWRIENNDFVISKFTNNSDEFHETCLNLLKVIPNNKRKDVINYLFTLMLKGEIKSIKELDLEKIKEIINKMPHLNKEEKKELIKFFKILVKCSIPKINYKNKLIKKSRQKT